MLKILGLIGPILRLASGTIRPITDMIGKTPELLEDFGKRADKSPGKSSAGVLGAIAVWLGFDLGYLDPIGSMLMNFGAFLQGIPFTG